MSARECMCVCMFTCVCVCGCVCVWCVLHAVDGVRCAHVCVVIDHTQQTHMQTHIQKHVQTTCKHHANTPPHALLQDNAILLGNKALSAVESKLSSRKLDAGSA